MALLCLGRSPGTGRDGPPFPGSEALVPRGSPAFRPVSWSGEAATHLHIEDGLWDRDGTSRFPPCLGAHRFEELFCFLDFFSPRFPPEVLTSLPSLRPQTVDPSTESVRHVRSLPQLWSPRGSSQGRPSQRQGRGHRLQTITPLLQPWRPLRPRVCTGTCPKGRLLSLSWLCTPEPKPHEIYYAGS